VRRIGQFLGALWVAFMHAATFFALIVLLAWTLQMLNIRNPLEGLQIPLVSHVSRARIESSAVSALNANLPPTANPLVGTPAGVEWLEAYMAEIRYRAVGSKPKEPVPPGMPHADMPPVDERF
jgi:hypothetical protein